MVSGHVGLAITIVGIAFSQNYSVERDVRMKAGDSVSIHNYQFTFREVKDITGPTTGAVSPLLALPEMVNQKPRCMRKNASITAPVR
jgi:cytochrome c biogenesis factor